MAAFCLLTSVALTLDAQGTDPPTFSPPGGTYTTAQTVTLNDTTAGATIRYTTDGSTPSETAGTVYATPFPVSVTTTVNAIAYAAGLADSAVSTATYTIVPPPSLISVSPASGAGGTQVAVSGSGFGTAQGTGQVWLGTAPAIIVNWSPTLIVATVAANATSGAAQVQQGGSWSNALTFTVNTAAIANVTPSSGVPGTQVTIAGSGFGASQGGGQVWLGTANAAAVSWSDTQVVANVAAGAATGNAQILQNGVVSNALPFTVNTLQIANVSPTSGVAGASVIFTGSGFGTSQGSGIVWLGSTAGQAIGWSDTQVVASVASGAVSGVARIQQNGGWSNALGFTVPVAGGNTVMPSMLNMVVGDTHTVQALNAAGQSVIGLTWTSSNPSVVSLSTDDPPVLTALAVGRTTITAGTGSADVTVSASLAPGTVIWSNPGDGSGVTAVVPAVPSATGVADIFAFQADGTVQAITADGTTAWTAVVSEPSPPPGFQARPAMPIFRRKRTGGAGIWERGICAPMWYRLTMASRSLPCRIF